MNAFCEHLGAHLGFGGQVVGEVISVPVPRLAVECTRAATSVSRTRTGPTAAAGSAPTPSPSSTRSSTSGTTSRSRTVLRGAGYVRVVRRRQQRRRLLPPAAVVPRRTPSCIRSTYWRTASTSRTSSSCTRPRSCRCSPATTSPDRSPTSTSPSRSKATISSRSTTCSSGVEAINGGLGIAVTKSWGMIDNRTISGGHPGRRIDLRRAVHGLYRPDRPAKRTHTGESRKRATPVRRRGDPSVHPGHPHLVAPALLDPPALATAE